MRTLFKPLTLIKREPSVTKHFPITHLNSEQVFETHSGQQGIVIELQGVSFATASNDALNYYRLIWHQALCLLNENFCLYTQVVRQKINTQLKGKFKEAFCEEVNQQYQQQFQQQALYQNKLYLVLLHKGPSLPHWQLNLFTLLNKNQSIHKQRQQFRSSNKKILLAMAEQLISSLKLFQPKLLGSTNEGFSELLRYLPLSINGLKTLPFFYSPYYPAISPGINSHCENIKKYPEGNLGNYLSCKRISFGDYIELSEAEEKIYACMLSIKLYGNRSHSLMFDKLLQLDCEFIHSNSFALEDKTKAQSLINKQHIRLSNSNDPAISQQQALDECKDLLASDRLKLGYHHCSLMLVADNKKQIEDSMNQAIKIFAESGFVAVKETLGQEAAFWAQIPGNQRFIARSAMVTSLNFVDFSPLHNYQKGYCDGNHLGSAVSLLETPSHTPVFFNFHKQGSGKKNDLTPGHTTIIGGNGSGKTVFIGFMDSQMSRYGGRSFFFDRDFGLSIYVKACNGSYANIAPGENLQFNPFQLSDTKSNRSFLIQWLCQLVKKDEESEVPEAISIQLADCVHFAFDTLAQEYRKLSSVVKLLPIDFSRWHRLKRWLHADGNENDGEFAYLFDNQHDSLDLKASKCGFDLTYLSKQNNTVLSTCLMYIFHRIEESLDGQRVSIYLDEGWMYLNNTYWQKKLSSWLPTLRKKNCHLVLATQSPQSILDSSLSAQFLDNCATNIFFCNPNANYQKHYQHFGLNPSEFDFIKNTSPSKRLFLYKQEQQSIICKLNLNTLTKELSVYSANTQTSALAEKLIQQLGNDAAIWLPEFYQQVNEEQL